MTAPAFLRSVTVSPSSFYIILILDAKPIVDANPL